MLFNSYVFIFLFLPLCLLGFFVLQGAGWHRLGIFWLVMASLFFYGWWNPLYLSLIILSTLFNYAVGRALDHWRGSPAGRLLLVFGIAANLSVLFWFKYANFFVNNLNVHGGLHLHLDPIILPLGISFFTFQKIAFLVDAFRGETRGYNPIDFSLFVVFFPQLIAGPIVHHKEMIPQFGRNRAGRPVSENFAVGSAIFFIGLFKKTLLADHLASVWSSPVFLAMAQGTAPNFFEAWGGILAYTFQLYFDFSGYSDMAIGLARLFGIRLPLNFNSPYKAVNIIDFWRRWHMTLSRFLRDYLYIPLGGNRKGVMRRYVNLGVTMFLGGFWHGANWTFVVWGLLHGGYLVINHAWHAIRRGIGLQNPTGAPWGRGFSRAITFLAVVLAWVFFRADSCRSAFAMLKAMAGFSGFCLPPDWFRHFGFMGKWMLAHGWQARDASLFAGIREGSLWPLFLIAWLAPNTQQWMARFDPALETKFAAPPTTLPWFQWRPSLAWAFFCALIAAIAVLGLGHISEFLYFQF